MDNVGYISGETAAGRTATTATGAIASADRSAAAACLRTASGAELVSSRQNPRVQALARLRDRAERQERGLFLVEGLREVSRAQAAAVAVREIYFQPTFFKRREEAFALLDDAAKRGIALCELSASAFEKVSAREGADGLLATAAIPDISLGMLAARLDATETSPAPSAPATSLATDSPAHDRANPAARRAPPLFLVAEAVEKPGNLGALFRTADSVGCTALLCCDPVADIFNPNAVRASQGALFSVPCAVARPAEVAAFLARRGVAVFATSPAARGRYWESDFRPPTAILLGSEKDGLSPFWLDAAARPAGLDVRAISIPQSGLSDSLNVGMAAAICLYEARRQRASAG